MLTILLSLMCYWVSLTDKAGANTVALSPDAIALRTQYDIAIDSLDYPVSPIYLDSLRRAGARVCHTSRWMNGVTVVMTDSLAQAMRGWSFVREVECTYNASMTVQAPMRKNQDVEALILDTSKVTDKQLDIINLRSLHQAGYRGQGIKMAVIDCGYPGVDTMQCFGSLRDEGRLLGIRDYTIENSPQDALINKHGTLCAMLILGQLPKYCGAAPEASAYFIRTEEYLSESPKEPDNWIAAIEFCDSVGVQLTSTSLGYSAYDAPFTSVTYAQLDGKTTRCTRAAVIASRKGMLLCQAAGNEGRNTTGWHWTLTPADADSILTIGAVDKDSVIADFSSYGNTSDGRLKPDLCAMGVANHLINPGDGQWYVANGTSFACPLVAGMAACIWSAHPEESAEQIRQRILNSCHLRNAPVVKYGNGIPNAYEAAGRPVVTEINDNHNDNHNIKKYMRNGVLVVERNGIRYDVLGRKQ